VWSAAIAIEMGGLRAGLVDRAKGDLARQNT
jgi:hypothetical protein